MKFNSWNCSYFRLSGKTQQTKVKDWDEVMKVGVPVDNVIVAIIYNVRALYIYNVRRLRSFKDIARKRRVKQNSVGN